ncbi:CDP-alcohol phosphatidyltransferase family protein [Gemmatimonadota bacterium]
MKDAFGNTRDMLKDTGERKHRRQEILEKERMYTLANFLSFSRLILIPFVVLCLVANTPGYNRLALVLLLLAGFTDYLDGIAARRRNEISQLGKILDPVADKLFIGVLGLALVFLRGLPVWFVALFVIRDLLILAAAYLLFLNKDIVLTSNWMGKITTFILLMTLVVYTINWQLMELPLVYIAGVLVISSGLIYTKKFFGILQQIKGRSGSPAPQEESPA